MMYENAARQMKLLRIQNGLTQKQLADELKVTEKYISTLERKAKKASLNFYKELANYFKVSLDYLFMDM